MLLSDPLLDRITDRGRFRPSTGPSSFFKISTMGVTRYLKLYEHLPQPPFLRPLPSPRASCLVPTRMPMRRLMELEPPGPMRYLIGVAIMMVGVVLPLGYMLFRHKRVPSASSSSSSSSFPKQT
ncbi:uncharacterized protein [Elaeis guineensis]